MTTVTSMRRVTTVAVAMALFVTLSACGKNPRALRYKYRITMAVRDGGQLLTASSVIGVRDAVSDGSMVGGSSDAVCGEATALRLRNGSFLFALFRGPSDARWPETKWPFSSPIWILRKRLGLDVSWPDDQAGMTKLETQFNSGVTAILQDDEFPELAAMRDANSPLTTGLADPKRLPPYLGDDVKIEKITIQVTQDRITKGRLAELFPWFNAWNEHLNGNNGASHVLSQYRTNQFSRCDLEYTLFPSWLR
jgi:hypothetical protein